MIGGLLLLLLGLQGRSYGFGLICVTFSLFRLKTGQLLLMLDGKRTLIHLLVGYMLDYLLLGRVLLSIL